MIEKEFEPDWACPPGENIKEVLKKNQWTIEEFAKRMGFTKNNVEHLLKGKTVITEDIALNLVKVLGSSIHFWLKLESFYRANLSRQKQKKELEQQKEWLKKFPIKQMVKFGWIPKLKEKKEQLQACLAFFGVSSNVEWKKIYLKPLAAFKASKEFEKKPEAVSTWIRQGEIMASKIKCEPFNKKKLTQLLPKLRNLTNETVPSIFIPKLTKDCADCGVAVVFLPHPSGCPVSGATRWLSQDKALLMLSLRYKTNDHLWVSFFHEIAHLLLHAKKMFFLEIENISNKEEEEADIFAREQLIPPKYNSDLINLSLDKNSIYKFAEKVGVAEGIVVGRLQERFKGDKSLKKVSKLNGLKIRYKWNIPSS